MSFSDEQLLNLVNNTILTKSEFELKDFTGGGVQITSTHNHKIIKYKIYLTFGYDEKRNSRSYKEDIDEDISFIWQKAILLKVKSMQVLKTGSSLSDLNKLMNTDNKIEDSDIEIIDSDKECNDIILTSLRTPKENKSLKVLTVEKLAEYGNINIGAFNEWVDHKKYKTISPITKLLNMFTKYTLQQQQEMVDKAIMNGWKGLVEPKTQAQPLQSFKQQDKQTTDNAIDAFLDARENGFDLRNVNSETVQDAEVIEG